jgi:hypothetical protein
MDKTSIIPLRAPIKTLSLFFPIFV